MKINVLCSFVSTVFLISMKSTGENKCIALSQGQFFSSAQKALMKINVLHSFVSMGFLISIKSADEKKCIVF